MKQLLYSLAKVAAILSLVVLPLSGAAQVTLGHYTFNTGVDASKWITLSNPVQFNTNAAGTDAHASAVKDIGFPFPFGDGVYTKFSCNSDGNIRLGNTATGTSNYSTPFSAANANINNPKINMLGCDGFIPDSGYFKMQNTVDANGDPLLVIEIATATFNTDSRPALLRWQVHLYPDGRITTVFFNRAPSIMPNVTRQPGLCVNASDITLINADHTVSHHTSGVASSNVALGNWPDPNRYYSFTPPVETCPRPTGLQISNIASDGFDLSWQPAAGASAYLLQIGNDAPFEVYSTNYSASGLSPQTDYSVRLASLCSASDTSFFVTASLTTPCTDILSDSLPYSYGFEDATGSGSSYTYNSCYGRYREGTTTAYPYPSSTNKHSGNYGAYLYSSASTTSWTTLPPFESNINQLAITFWGYKTSANYGHLVIGVMTDPEDLSTFDTVASYQISANNTWEKIECPLSSYSGNGRFIAILSANTGATNITYIDDITVDLLPDCAMPSNLTVSNIVPDGFDLAWTDEGSASAFIVRLEQGSASPVDDISYYSGYTFSSLTPGADYTVSIAALCGSDTSWWLSTNVHTPCVDIPTDSLPYTYGFEDASGSGAANNFNSCFGRYRAGTSTAYPYPSSTYEYEGSYGCYFYSTSSACSWLTLPPFENSPNTLSLSFWAYKTSANYGHIAIGVMTDPEDISTFDTIATYQVATISTWEYFETSLSSYAGTGRYIAILSPSRSAASYVYIDNISVGLPPACARPSDLRVESTTKSTLTLAWHDEGTNGEFVLEYGPRGFESGGPSATVINGIYDTTVTITDLTMGQYYDFNLFVVCGSDTSAVLPATFPAGCGNIEADDLPYIETFETYLSGSANPINACWNKFSSTTTAYPYPYTTAAINGDRGLYFYGNRTSTTQNYSYAVLPKVDENLQMSDLMIDFMIRRYTSASTSTSTYSTTIMVGIATSPDSVASMDIIDTIDLTAEERGSIHNPEVSFENYTGQGRYIVLYAPAPPYVTSSNYNYVHIDDLTLRAIPTCFRPSEVTASQILPTEVSLVWTPDSRTMAPSYWQIEYGPQGFTPGDANSTTTSAYDTSATIDQLLPNTEYDVYISAVCGSDISDPRYFSFRTRCSPVLTTELPYIENFESYGSASTQPISPCWVKGTNHTTAYPYPSSTAAINGDRGLYMYGYNTSTAANYSYAALPLFEADLTSLRLNFKSKKSSSTSSSTTTYGYRVIVGVMTDPADLSTFDTVSIFDRTADEPSSIDSHEVSFEYYTGSGRYIALYAPTILRGTATTAYNYAYVDDVVVSLLPDCRRPLELSATEVNAHDASFSWIGSADAYEVAYDTLHTFATALSSTVYDTFATLSSLLDYKQYWVRVRALCSGGTETSDWSLPIAIRTLIDCGNDYLNVTDTLLRGTSSSYNTILGTYGSYQLQKTWHIITPADLGGLEMLDSLNIIKSISLETGTASRTEAIPFRIYMAETDLNEWPSTGTSTSGVYDTLPASDMTLVFDGVQAFTASSWNEIVLDHPFTYSGNRNLVVAFVRDSLLSGTTSVYFRYGSVENYVNAYQYVSSSGTASTYRQRYGANMIFNVCKHVPDCSRPTSVVVTDTRDTSFSLQWDGSAAAYQLLVSRTSVNPDSASNPVYSATVTGNSIVVGGLSQQSTYYFYLRSICGSDFSEWTIEQSVSTLCSPRQLPYRENFDSYPAGTTAANGQTLDPCWTKGTNNSTAYPYLYTTNANSAPNGLYFYASASYYSYAALPLMADSVRHLNLTFAFRKTGASYGNLRVGIMTDPNDISTFNFYKRINVQQASQWFMQEVDFSAYTGPEGVIAFLLPDSAANYVVIDDIEVTRLPDCVRPHSPSISNITANGATFSWTDPAATGNYIIQCVSRDDGSVLTFSSNTNSITLSGLQPGTRYECSMRSLCASGDSSLWTLPIPFMTSCAPRQLPIFIDFENEATGSGTTVVRHPCWHIVNNATSATYQTYPYVYSSSANAHSGNNVMYYYFSTTSSYPSDMTFVGPEIDTLAHPLNTIEVNFWAKHSTNRMSVIVGAMTNPTDITTFVAVDTVPLTSTVAEYTVSFDSYAGHGSYVAFRGVRDTSATLYIYLDDIMITPIPPCPRNYDLAVSNATSTSALLSWTDDAGSSQWKVELSNLTSGTVDTITATSNPYTITSLSPSSVYSFRVAPVCASGEVSQFSRESLMFGTAQVPAAMPYSYDFEDGAEWANWQTSSSNTTNWHRGNVARGNNTNALYISTDGGQTHSWNMNVITNAVAYRDIDFGPDTGSFQVQFDYYGGGTIGANRDGVSVIVTDPSVIVVSSNSAITSPWGNINNVGLGTARRDTTWSRRTIYIDGVSGVKRVAFYHFNQGLGATEAYLDNPSAIDNIAITPQNCPRPYDVTVGSVGATTVDLSWSGDDSSLYIIDYRPAGTTGTDLFDTVSGLSHTVTGLQPSTDYWIWVRRVCNDSTLSAWTTNRAFTTLCVPISVADTLREDFESIAGTAYNATGNLPNCWESFHTGSNTYTPHVTNGSTYSYCVNGTNAVTLSGNGATSGTPTYGEAFLTLPNILEPTNSLTLAYWFCSESATYGQLSVGYLTGPDYTTDFVPVKVVPVSNQTLHVNNGLQTTKGIRDTIRFENLPDGNFPICFKWISTSNTLYSASIDDVSVWTSFVAPVCNAPAVTISNITYQSATVTASASASSYEMRYGLDPQALTETLTADSTGIFSLSALQMDTTYHISLRAICGEGYSSDWVDTSFSTPMQPCAAPTNVSSSNIGLTSATISWSSNTDGNTWQIKVSGNHVDTTYTVTSNPFTIGSLVPDETYSVTVRTVCGPTVQSPWSSPHTFSTTRCDAVTGVSVTNVTENGATVTWNASPGSNGNYQLEYGPLSFAQGTGTRINVSGTSYTIAGLQDLTSYSVYVRAECAEGVYSAWSDVQDFTTLENDPDVTYFTVTVTYDASMGTVVGAGRYAEGTQITLTASSNPGFHFVEWAEDHLTDSVRTVLVDSDLSFTATFASNVGIDDIDLSSLTLYPNPATTTVTLSGLGAESQINIVDLNGRTVMHFTANSPETTLDITTLAKGTYFVRVVTNGSTTVRKILVR